MSDFGTLFHISIFHDNVPDTELTVSTEGSDQPHGVGPSALGAAPNPVGTHPSDVGAADHAATTASVLGTADMVDGGDAVLDAAESPVQSVIPTLEHYFTLAFSTTMKVIAQVFHIYPIYYTTLLSFTGCHRKYEVIKKLSLRQRTIHRFALRYDYFTMKANMLLLPLMYNCTMSLSLQMFQMFQGSMCEHLLSVHSYKVTYFLCKFVHTILRTSFYNNMPFL